MKKVLLICPEYNYPIWSEMYPNGALALFKAIGKQEGADVQTIQMVSDKHTVQSVLDCINGFKPDLIGLTFTTFQVRPAKELSKAIKSRFNIPIVAGGEHVSSIGACSIEDFPDIDVFISGEGESAFRDLIRNGHSGGKRYIRGEQSNLDELPLPDYSGADLDKYTGAPPPAAKPSMFMMASRGCPFQCTFCNKSVYGSKVRVKSPETVLKELEAFRDMGVKEVFFQDDTLNLNHDWLYEILDRMKSAHLDMVFRAPFRANERLINPALLKRLKDAGFWLIFYGVESGDEAILKSIKKGLTIPEIERAFKITHEAGIKTEASFIVGLPGETHETVKKSWNLYRKLNPFWVGFSAAVPFPNTELSKVGCVLDTDYEHYQFGAPLMQTDALTSDEIVSYAHKYNMMAQRYKIRNMVLGGRTLAWGVSRFTDYKPK